MIASDPARRHGGCPFKGMPARVIWNPASGGGSRDPEEVLAGLGFLDTVVTEGRGDAREAARAWPEGLLVVAGGDGTVNEAVNGLAEAGFPDGVILALLPSGTGNDLARTLAVPTDPGGALAVLRGGAVRKLDAARLRLRGSGERFFVNAAVGGLGAEVSRGAADRALKGRWGRLAYPRAYLSTQDRIAHRVRVTLDGETRELRAANVVVGNGRYAGGGMPAAPGAHPGDGLLDLVAVEHADPLGLLSAAARSLVRGDGPSGGVFSARARRILLDADPPLEFNADGEPAGRGPAEFEAVPGALNVVVGPGYLEAHTSRP